MAIKNEHLTPDEVSSWQNDVKDKDLIVAPVSPADNARYIVAGLGGAWAGASINDIAWFLNSAWVFVSPIAGMKVYIEDETTEYTYTGSIWKSENNTLQIVLGQVGSALVVGFAGELVVPYDSQIISAEMHSQLTGSVVVDIWKKPFASLPAVNADSITASAPLTITSGNKVKDLILTGWNKVLTEGEYLYFNIDSNSIIELLHITLSLKRV